VVHIDIEMPIAPYLLQFRPKRRAFAAQDSRYLLVALSVFQPLGG
jgi:hypothetical protein